MQSYNPWAARHPGLGSSLFARHYLGNHYYFLFLLLLRCFSSEGWLPPFGVTRVAPCRVAPFGHPGITACVQLPQAYRSLPRPSSPLGAKASTVRRFVLDLKLFVLR